MHGIEGDHAVTTKPPSDDDLGVLERLDAGEPPSSPEEAQARAPYQRLFARVRSLDDVEPPSGWEDRAAARWSAAQTKRRRARIAVGLTAATGLAAAILLTLCTAQISGSGLQVAVSPAPGTPRRGDPAV